MPDQIRFFPLTRKELHLFQGFHCGDAPYATAVSSWITGKAGECEECAEQALRDRRCKIYYYRNAADKVIGFGAVGTTNGEWPQPTDPRTKVAIIPWMGIHSDFHGQPDGPDEVRYSDQILVDLIYKAKALQSQGKPLKLLVLFVHPENTRAIRVYERTGFARSTKRLGPGEHMGMSLDLTSV